MKMQARSWLIKYKKNMTAPLALAQKTGELHALGFSSAEGVAALS